MIKKLQQYHTSVISYRNVHGMPQGIQMFPTSRTPGHRNRISSPHSKDTSIITHRSGISNHILKMVGYIKL